MHIVVITDIVLKCILEPSLHPPSIQHSQYSFWVGVHIEYNVHHSVVITDIALKYILLPSLHPPLHPPFSFAFSLTYANANLYVKEKAKEVTHVEENARKAIPPFPFSLTYANANQCMLVCMCQSERLRTSIYISIYIYTYM